MIIGKTNVPELTLWPFTETATFGVTRNPWDLQRAPGGSSGGSAAAVAAGLVGAALGSDGAGSIRIPAAWCGLFGLKPQRGRVSLAPRARAWHGLSVNGVLTRSVADTRAVPRRRLRRDRRRPRPRAGARGPVLDRGGHAARAAEDRLLDARPARRDLEPRRATRAARWRRPSSCCARSGTRSQSATPTTAPDAMPAVHGALPARHPRRRGRARAPRAPGTAHARDGAPRRPDPAGAARALARGRGRARAQAEPGVRGPRRAADAVDRHAAAAHRPAAGPRRAVDAQRGRRHGPLQRRLERHRPARRVGAGGVRRRRAAARGAARGASRTTRRRCCRWPAQLEAERPWAQQRPAEFS